MDHLVGASKRLEGSSVSRNCLHFNISINFDARDAFCSSN